ASSSAAKRAVPSGTTRSHRPIASASAEVTWRPFRTMSSARPWPTSRGRRTVPPSMSGTPAPAVDAEISALLHDAQVAPEGQLHAAGDGRAGDRGDDRLGQAVYVLEGGPARLADPITPLL